MANNIFEQAFSGNQPKILAAQMKFQSLDHHIWGKLAKFNTPGGRPVTPDREPQVRNDAVVVIQNELKKAQGDHVKIPLHRLLTQRVTIGRNQMQDHEEEPKVNHALVPVELVRHAEKPKEGSMSLQRTKEYKLIEKVKPALLRHYSMYEEYDGCTYAMYNGFSYNILSSGSDLYGHSTITANSHPHIFVAGQGKVSYGTSNYPGTSGYETAIGTAIDAVGSSDLFDTDFLRGLKAHRQIQRIVPIVGNNGNMFRIIFAHNYQIASLEADSLFNTTTASVYAQQMAKDNPIITGCKYFWEGFAIYPTDTAVWPCSTSSGSPVWGVSTVSDYTSYQSYESETKFAGFVLGAGSLYKAFGQPFEFKKRMADYDEILGIAYRSVEGHARGDFWNDDDDTRGQHLVNDGSAVFITYAPAPSM